MKMKWLVWVVFFLVGIPLLVAGCSGAPFVASFTANAVSGPAPLSVSFNNTSSQADSYQWSLGDGNTTTTTSLSGLVTHEYTAAGSYNVTVTAVKGQKSVTSSGTIITVTHGKLASVKIEPTEATLDPNASQAFTLSCADAYGNPINDYQLTWQAENAAGTFKDGAFTAGTTAGTYPGALVATVKVGDTTLTANVDITVNPGPLDKVSVADVELPADGQHQFTFSAADQYGNPLEGLTPEWTLQDTTAGSLTSDGMLTATKKAGSHPDAVVLTIKQGTVAKTATASVNVAPAGLDQIFIAPENTQLGIGKSQQYVAVAADKYGNRLNDVNITWSANPAAGTFKGDTFVAGNKPDTYAQGVTATATWNGQTLAQSTGITVEPDRIVFLSNEPDPKGSVFEVYIMDSDGSNLQQLTYGANVQDVASSPDGRRIAYTTNTTLAIMNTDGQWGRVLLTQSGLAALSWSPDGKTLAYDVWEPAESVYNIYTVDIATGEVRQLTNNQVWNFDPSYSPDGKKIAFVEAYVQAGTVKYEIYVMNADGSNQTQVTDDSWPNMEPNWTPDGQKIIYVSAHNNYYGLYTIKPDGSDLEHFLTPNDKAVRVPDYSPDGTQLVVAWGSVSFGWDIAVVNADGTGLHRITDSTNDWNSYDPSWMKRMEGVPVNVDAIVIPDETGTTTQMTVQQVTDKYQTAVVRIETDLAIGTGFIIKSNGTIMTAAHVVKNAKKITVYLNDGTTYTGTVLGMDTIHDIALVKIDATGLPVIGLASGGPAALGQQVVVLGFALGSKNLSVTTGIVSSSQYDSGTNVHWVQTDSAINPGNSGGPMLNLDGQLIGMVTEKAVGYAVEGVGYAISTETLLTYIQALEG